MLQASRDRGHAPDPRTGLTPTLQAYADIALVTRPPQVRHYVNGLMDRFTSGNEYDQVYCLRRDLKEACASIQQYQRAAKPRQAAPQPRGRR